MFGKMHSAVLVQRLQRVAVFRMEDDSKQAEDGQEFQDLTCELETESSDKPPFADDACAPVDATTAQSHSTNPPMHETCQIPEASTAPLREVCALEQTEKQSMVRFTEVDVYFFNRCQGYTVVPSSTGPALSMENKHFNNITLPLDETNEDVRLADLLERCSAGTESRQLKKSVSGAFLEPLDGRWRRALLSQCGVNIEKSVIEETNKLARKRRKFYCSCKNHCANRACSCIRNELPCLKGEETFSCSCSEENCSNPSGYFFVDEERISAYVKAKIQEMSDK
uniref:Cysteine/serine-rich nuclear protein N-terminal domain-containing protein n=1 Tax=Trichuris muris TaxID=70415 RepID=A0A5S6QJ64_TRIMR